MNFNEVAALLDPAPLPLEMGYERLPDGVLHVAARTDMYRCTGKMFEWWFRFGPDTQQYSWWHPVDHGPSRWANTTEGTHIGSEHLLEEGFTGLPSQALIVQFRDPSEFFDQAAFDAARASGAISGAVLGRVGFSHEPPRDPSGAVLGGRLLHIARDTEWGCVLRSHFFLGQDLVTAGLSPSEIAAEVPDVLGKGLLVHAYDEFHYLSRFLPSLYLAENRKAERPATPWGGGVSFSP